MTDGLEGSQQDQRNDMLIGPDRTASAALFDGVGAPLVDEQLHLDFKNQWELDIIGIGPKEPAVNPTRRRFSVSTVCRDYHFRKRVVHGGNVYQQGF